MDKEVNNTILKKWSKATEFGEERSQFDSSKVVKVSQKNAELEFDLVQLKMEHDVPDPSGTGWGFELFQFNRISNQASVVVKATTLHIFNIIIHRFYTKSSHERMWNKVVPYTSLNELNITSRNMWGHIQDVCMRVA